jgi:hypothetical protein
MDGLVSWDAGLKPQNASPEPPQSTPGCPAQPFRGIKLAIFYYDIII